MKVGESQTTELEEEVYGEQGNNSDVRRGPCLSKFENALQR